MQQQQRQAKHLERFSLALNKLQTSFQGLINYQDDAQTCRQAVPDLNRLLNDFDSQIVFNTIIFMEQLSSKEASSHALINEDLLVRLLNRIDSNSSMDICISVSNILDNLNEPIYISKGYHKILISNFETLAKSLKQLVVINNNIVNKCVVKILYSLINNSNSLELIKTHLIRSNLIAPLANILVYSQNDEKLMIHLLHLLCKLAHSDNEVKIFMSKTDIAQCLLDILQKYSSTKILSPCVRLITTLSTLQSNKIDLIQLDCAEYMIAFIIKPPTDDIFINSLYTLQNLSDCLTRIPSNTNYDLLIKSLIDILNINARLFVTECAIGILANLTANQNDDLISLFFKYNGIMSVDNVVDDLEQKNIKINDSFAFLYKNIKTNDAISIQQQQAMAIV